MEFAIVAFLVVVFLVPIIYFASRAAKKGRRYMGTEDPIQRYEDQAEASLGFPWGGFWAGAQNYGGWQWRVRLQQRLGERRRLRSKRSQEGPDRKPHRGREVR